jgi:hypothetical protein
LAPRSGDGKTVIASLGGRHDQGALLGEDAIDPRHLDVGPRARAIA